MRVLRFIVEGQAIRLDPSCDFSGLVPGTEGYLAAEFQFSSDWRGLTKVAGFWSSTENEYPPQILRDGRFCMIPAEALKKKSFKVQIIGKKHDLTLVTNKVVVMQDGR